LYREQLPELTSGLGVDSFLVYNQSMGIDPIVFGVVGVILLIVAFTLADTGYLKTRPRLYYLLNLSGALLLAIYALELKAYVFVVLEVFWVLIAGFEILLKRR